MINFYAVWKEDKERESKPDTKKKYKCKLCNARVNGLKDHVRDMHGSWDKYLEAENYIEQQRFKEVYEGLRNSPNRDSR